MVDSIRLSKAMSFALRHKPENMHLTLDAAGWVPLTDLASALTTHFAEHVTVEDVLAVAEVDSKQRYTVRAGLIRAAQGHTIPVQLDLAPTMPPAVLYHGTVTKFVPAIMSEGLKPQARRHVHLSATVEVATTVGSRRGEAVILTVDAAAAHQGGVAFYQAENGVWLSPHIPAKYISFP